MAEENPYAHRNHEYPMPIDPMLVAALATNIGSQFKTIEKSVVSDNHSARQHVIGQGTVDPRKIIETLAEENKQFMQQNQPAPPPQPTPPGPAFQPNQTYSEGSVRTESATAPQTYPQYPGNGQYHYDQHTNTYYPFPQNFTGYPPPQQQVIPQPFQSGHAAYYHAPQVPVAPNPPIPLTPSDLNGEKIINLLIEIKNSLNYIAQQLTPDPVSDELDS